MLLTHSIDSVDVNIEHTHGCDADSISINTILHQERIVVDHGSSKQLFDNKMLLGAFMVNVLKDVDLATLDNVHFF
jgi:hypothetical protein